MESESSTTAIVSCLTKEAETVTDNFSSTSRVLLVRRLRGEGDGDATGVEDPLGDSGRVGVCNP